MPTTLPSGLMSQMDHNLAVHHSGGRTDSGRDSTSSSGPTGVAREVRPKSTPCVSLRTSNDRGVPCGRWFRALSPASFVAFTAAVNLRSRRTFSAHPPLASVFCDPIGAGVVGGAVGDVLSGVVGGWRYRDSSKNHELPAYPLRPARR